MDKPGNRQLTDRTFFVTFVIEGRKPVFRNEELTQKFLGTLQYFRTTREIELYGYVVMPDHVHVLCKVVHGMTISSFVRRVKTFTSRNCEFYWQDGYWSVMIVGPDMLQEKLKYMHENPVRAELVEEIEEYPWSSAAEYYLKETSELLDPY
jgi:putative transposase